MYFHLPQTKDKIIRRIKQSIIYPAKGAINKALKITQASD
jgi:hypothetical protein